MSHDLMQQHTGVMGHRPARRTRSPSTSMTMAPMYPVKHTNTPTAPWNGSGSTQTPHRSLGAPFPGDCCESRYLRCIFGQRNRCSGCLDWHILIDLPIPKGHRTVMFPFPHPSLSAPQIPRSPEYQSRMSSIFTENVEGVVTCTRATGP